MLEPAPRPLGDDLVGRTLGDFVVRERIGGGSYGSVYRALQLVLRREAVIKVLQTSLRDNEQAMQRFLREARLASRLDHPYAAHIYAFGVEADGLPWIAMELVDGIALDTFLDTRGALAVDVAIPFVEGLCEVVHTAHERGIIHRDIKPPNVMVLSRAGRMLPKLLDLGIAKAVTIPLLGDRTPARGRASRAMDDSVDGHITLRGAILGSPGYMAPEQWSDSGEADERTDIYALGVLTYEVLTARLPFHEDTLVELMRAHLSAAPPPLGGELPGALDAVIARALAKRPEDRFASALELAAALRTAAGLAPEPVPQLPAALRDDWVRGAPQPLAEAIAALDAARSTREARDAVDDLVATIVRYLGVIALACAAGLETAREPLRACFRDLRARRFSDEDWWQLCGTLARSADPDAFAIPELARFFADTTETLEALTAKRPRGTRQRDEHLATVLGRVAEVLERLAFVFRYPLVVVADDRLELWMGVRRPKRAALPKTVAVPAGTTCLVTADGRLAIALTPLAEVAPPTPGAPEELFLLDGRGARDGARLVALPVGFECNRDELWPWFVEHVDDLTAQIEISAGEESPYLGLMAFGSNDAARFFGRERETDAFLNRLRVQPLIAVVGASGAGKSSFVQAGVLPNLPSGWRAITIRPGSEPLASLEAMLARLGVDPDGRDVARDPDAVGQALRRLGDAGGHVVVVDQFEELFTLCQDPAHQAVFADVLVRAARTAADPVRVILTLRDDFLVRAEQLPSLRQRLTWGVQVLATPARSDLIRILVEPARRAGYAFEDLELPAEMVDAVAGKPGSLALLAFTAAALWRERDQATRRFTRATYVAMGGVGGALARHAEGVLDGMIHEERALVREAFRHLVTADGTRAVIARGDLCTILDNPRADAVLEKLIDARLLVASEGADASAADGIEIIHEALLATWPRLRDWVLDDREGARLRDQLRLAAQQWHDRHRPSGLLWRGDALAEYQLWRARHRGALSEIEEAFAKASISEAARGRRLRRIAIASVVGTLSLAIVVLIRLRGTAETERRRAEAFAASSHEQLVVQLEAQGREALLAGDVVRASDHLLRAYDEGLRGDGLAIMLHRAVASRSAEIRAFAVGLPVRWAELAPDGSRLLTVRDGDGRVSIWDLATGDELMHVTGAGETRAAHFDATGRRVAIAGTRPQLWDLTTNARRPLARKPVTALQWGPGDTIVTLGPTEAQLWNAATATAIRTLDVKKPWTTSLAVTAERIATSDDRSVEIWDRDGRLVRRLDGHRDEILKLAFSPDRSLLATASADGTARLWDLATGAELAVCNHGGRIANVAFDPAGRHLLTTSDSGSAKLWDLHGMLTSSFAERRGKLTSGEFDAAGTAVVVAGTDGVACLYEVPAGALMHCLEGHAKAITAARFSPDGREVLTASLDGTARLWRTDVRDFAASLPHDDRVRAIVALPELGTIATTDWAGKLHVWSTTDGHEHWSALAHERGVTSLSTHRGMLLTTGPDGARVWNATTGKAVVTVTSRLGAYTDGVLLDDALVLANDQGVIEIRSATGADGRSVVAHSGSISQLAIGSGLIVSAGADGTAAVIDAATGNRLRTLAGHHGPVTDVALNADGSMIATVGNDHTARLWDREGHQLLVLPSIGAMRLPRFDGYGRLLTAHEDGDVYVWDTRIGTPIARLHGHTANVWSLAVSADGRLAISSSKDGTAILWDLDRLGGVLRLETSDVPIVATAFAAPGVVATGSWDHTVKLWRFEPAALDDEVARARR